MSVVVSELLALAERCEAATGPDRELDELAHMAVGYRLVDANANERLPDVKRWVGPDGVRTGWVHNRDSYDYPRAYTASLDAALTLVAEGLWIEALIGDWRTLVRIGRNGEWKHDPNFSGYAVTPALALCAAALRARAAPSGAEQ